MFRKYETTRLSVPNLPRAVVKPLVLVVEDQEVNADILRQLLHKIGICCAWARNGAEAVEMFLEASPGTFQAILMDIQMPNMDGYEATKAIRSSGHPDAKNIAIIALSANAFNEDVAKSISNGMNDHVAKPIEMESLAAALNRAFAHAYQSTVNKTV